MSFVTKKWVGILLACALIFITDSARDLFGQAKTLPSVGGNQPPASMRIGGIQAGASQITQGGNKPVLRGGFNNGPVVAGGYAGGAYPGYYGPTYEDPAGAYLSGASQVISSQAQFMVSEQQAAAMKEQNKQTQLDTRRKTLEEWRYEQNLMPTAAELRTKQEKAQLDRMRNNPPSVDIWSGEALNTLLQDIQKLQGQIGTGPTIPLDPAMLAKVNVTDGKSPGLGVLQQNGTLNWPYSLQFDFFKGATKKMEETMVDAAKQIASGKQPEFRLITAMNNTENDLRSILKDHINDLTPSQGIEARRYLNDVHETIRTFQDPNVAKYVNGQWMAKGNNVGDLVAYLTSQGLKFAPAAPGNEFVYTSLYQSMVNYDRALDAVVSR
jgi:hypothetical protein